MVEQPAVNRFVVGSSPTRGALPGRAEKRYNLVNAKRRGNHPLGVSRFRLFFAGFRALVPSAELSGLGEIMRCPSVTLWVTLGHRTSRGKTLTLSGRDANRVN